MDFVYLLQEREFVRINEQTYTIGKTSLMLDKWINVCPRGSRLFLFCNVSDCHKVCSNIANVFDHFFERRLDYGEEHIYSGNLETMKREFLLCVLNDIYGTETEIVDMVEEVPERRVSRALPAISANRRESMLRKMGRVSVLRLKEI